MAGALGARGGGLSISLLDEGLYCTVEVVRSEGAGGLYCTVGVVWSMGALEGELGGVRRDGSASRASLINLSCGSM